MIEQHKPTTPVSQLRPIELPPEQPIDVGRYANALRRSKLLIAAIVIAVTGIVLLMSLALPKTYSADATILFDESQSIATTSTTDAERQLATIQKLLVTRDVLARSARRLPGETVASLGGKISASVDPTANIVTITADASTPKRAAQIANVVAASFLARERGAELYPWLPVRYVARVEFNSLGRIANTSSEDGGRPLERVIAHARSWPTRCGTRAG